MRPPLRVVFDCVVFLQAATHRGGPSGQCLSLLEGGHLTLILSATVLAEVATVLSRPRLAARFPSLTPEYRSRLLQFLRLNAELIADVPSAVLFPRDPKDAPYLDLCLAGKADFLLSWDRDLLDLNAPGMYESHGLPDTLIITDPASFLARFRAQTED